MEADDVNGLTSAGVPLFHFGERLGVVGVAIMRVLNGTRRFFGMKNLLPVPGSSACFVKPGQVSLTFRRGERGDVVFPETPRPTFRRLLPVRHQGDSLGHFVSSQEGAMLLGSHSLFRVHFSQHARIGIRAQSSMQTPCAFFRIPFESDSQPDCTRFFRALMNAGNVQCLIWLHLSHAAPCQSDVPSIRRTR